jgi:hypothetical protein
LGSERYLVFDDVHMCGEPVGVDALASDGVVENGGETLREES